MKKLLKNGGVLAGIAGLLLILGIAANEFLFTKDCPDCLTGAQILAKEGAGFWLSAILGSLGIGAIVWFFAKKYTVTKDMSGIAGAMIGLMAMASIAFAKGCEDKAEGSAVTTQKGNPVKVVDSTRQAAEDMLKK